MPNIKQQHGGSGNLVSYLIMLFTLAGVVYLFFHGHPVYALLTAACGIGVAGRLAELNAGE